MDLKNSVFAAINKKEITFDLNSHLIKNSIFILFSSFSNAAFGFMFWIIAARSYTNEAIGIASAFISLVSLLVLISRFGFDQSLIKYFQERNKCDIFYTSLIVTAVSAFIFSAIWYLNLLRLSPDLVIIMEIPFVFFLVVMINSILSITGISFVALRKSRLFFFQNVFGGSRLIFLIPLTGLGTIGILVSYALSCILSLMFALVMLIKMGFGKPAFSVKFLKSSLEFSSGSYLISLLMTAPNFILPILVLNILGATTAAVFFITYTIASLLFMIPNSISTSLFVEGSHGESIKECTYRSVRLLCVLLLPAVIILFVLADIALGFFGEDYINGVHLLRLLLTSTIFISVVYVALSVKRIKNDTQFILIFSGILLISLLAASYLGMLSFGLIGIGYAWLFVYGLGGIFILLDLKFRTFRRARG